MEGNEALTKMTSRYFVVVEMILLVLVLATLGLFYGQTPGSVFLLIVTLSMLALWYLLKTITTDRQLRLKPRIIYFGCAIACASVLFALMQWPGYKVFLVGGLGCMALGWGVFLWSRQRSKHHPASGFMMLARLMLYTAACLLLLLTTETVTVTL